MKLVIDMDEDYYKAICEKVKRFGKGSVVLSTPEKMIFDGTPLEKELEKILSYTNSMAKNIIEQGPPDFNGFTNKDEALALFGFAYTKGIVKNRISEIKGDNRNETHD